MKFISGLAAVTAVLALVPTAAHAAGTFDGSCTTRGATFDVPGGVGVGAREVEASISAPLRCDGTVNGDRVSGASGLLKTDFSGPIGCTGTSRAMRGKGTLTVGLASIPVTFGLTFRGLTITFQGNGPDDGSFSGRGDFPADRNAGQMQRCPNGDLRTASFDGTIRTTKTLVARAAARAASTAAAPRLSFDRTQRAGSVLRRGTVRVRCIPAADGACTVRVLRGRSLLAAGTGSGAAGRPVLVTARLTAAGRKALRSRRGLTATVQVEAQGKRRSRTIRFTR